MRILLYLCFATWLVSCGQTKEKSGNDPMVVKVFQAIASETTGSREFTFISKPFQMTDLSFRVGGPMVRFDAQPGQFYRKGEVIASIDDRDFVIRKDRAEAVFYQVEAEYRRVAVLYEKNNVSSSSYEKAKSDLATAKAAFETTKNELKDTRLEAPFSGYVQAIHAERYQDIRVSQPVVTFIDLSKLKIETYIPENIAMAMTTGGDSFSHRLKLRFDALPGSEFFTSNIEISKSTTSNNLSFLLTAILDNPDARLLGGMSGGVAFDGVLDTGSASVVVPRIAVCHSPGGGDHVWILAPDQHVKRVPVKMGDLKTDNRVEVIEGVAPGEWVVLTGHAFLSDGEVVMTQKQEAR